MPLHRVWPNYGSVGTLSPDPCYFSLASGRGSTRNAPPKSPASVGLSTCQVLWGRQILAALPE